MAEMNLFNAIYNPDILSCLANLSNDEVFTPPEIANAMLDLLPQELFCNPDTTFLDPACKSGVFLREIAKRLLRGLEPQMPDLQQRIDHIFHKQLFGIAITELTSLLSRRSLYCSKYPNSTYSVSRFDDAQGNVRFKRIQHIWKDGKCQYCGASMAQYERGEELETHAYEWIHTRSPEEIFGMKFDVIISNPPYQLSDGGAQASAKPIYQLFVENSIKLSPHYLTMIIPARWYASGKGLESFRQKFISDTHIRELHDYPNTNDCFPGVNVRGGICYFLWDSTYNNIQNYCRVVTHDTDNLHSVMRPLQIQGSDIFIRYAAAIEVINKVKSFNECSIAQHISPRRPYGIDGSIIKTNHFHYSNNGLKRPVICYGKAGTKGFIEYTDVVSHIEWIDKWKVYMPYANNIGTELNDDNQNTFVGEPNSVCSETFIMIGAEMNLTKESAKNLCLYMRTKFARFLHSLSKTSQHGTAKTYQFVPTQDFTKPWTDEELYAKYGLSQEEIDFIESMIKPMETGGDQT